MCNRTQKLAILMEHVWRPACSLLLLAAIIALPTLAAGSIASTSEPTNELDPNLSRLMTLIRQAESAGATSEEVAGLVIPLNRALELSQAIRRTPPNGTQKREEYLTQFSGIVNNTETKASQLKTIVSQRSFVNEIVLYSISGLLAFFLAAACVFITSVWRRHRIRRTFEMRVITK